MVKWAATAACTATLSLYVLSLFETPRYDHADWTVRLEGGWAYFDRITLEGDSHFMASWQPGTHIPFNVVRSQHGQNWRAQFLPSFSRFTAPNDCASSHIHRAVITSVDVPLSTPLVLTTVCCAYFWWIARRRIPAGHCRECGYNLTGNVTGWCPECGTAVG